jgi:DNA-binding MarR family transcriptional regulator
MTIRMNSTDHQALAEFRFLLRCYLKNGEKAARSVGLEPQQYLGLLALRGIPSSQTATIQALAERLQIRHHSTVELVDRMEKRGLLRRERSEEDRRQIRLHVTPRGEKLLSRLVRHRITELRVIGPALTRALHSVVTAASHSRPATSRPRSGRQRKLASRARRCSNREFQACAVA